MGSVPVVIGAGLAGLATALSYAPSPVVVLGPKPSANLTSSALAQGGIAAAMGADDTIEDHALDTIRAGAGLCDKEAVRSIVADGPRAIRQLSSWGVSFDLDDSEQLALGLEGAHSRRRIVHAGGDQTGAMIMNALVARVWETPSIHFFEGAQARAIQTKEGAVTGVVFTQGEKAFEIETGHIVLATGSACALWHHATVPIRSWGQGLALAARAGAVLKDLEFVQFHPTALDVGKYPVPLLSEALRGEGALLLNEDGSRFVDELAARDVVARAISAEKKKGKRVFLDTRFIPDFKQHFITVNDVCQQVGLDPTKDLLPVTPVAHYHMGGVATDDQGATNVKGLYACGEVACTGLHGANRLASNSLLEAVVMGMRVAEQLVPQKTDIKIKPYERNVFPNLLPEPDVQDILSRYVGVVRSEEGLEKALELLQRRAATSDCAFVGAMIAAAALARTESRGGHYREDFPHTDTMSSYKGYKEGYENDHRFIA